ncbi:type II toxin-antitoxin system RelE/ParE family toxin [Nocardia sp. NBC_00881]|uniref:type II toxin-antitoxin system RelE family toxin n=1 Tax=Nocardia sp. NBC_00881 TaxID=2975995 RepID=UPI003870ADC1|nr:type II toxin-antitoxin system RelE/ParE family toxin [Nocardia sp. NBC_00881]
MRILTALTALGDDPYAPGSDVMKLSGHDDLYRLRVGRYRVAYRVDNGVLVILVVKVGWRKDIGAIAPRQVGRRHFASGRRLVR